MNSRSYAPVLPGHLKRSANRAPEGETDAKESQRPASSVRKEEKKKRMAELCGKELRR